MMRLSLFKVLLFWGGLMLPLTVPAQVTLLEEAYEEVLIQASYSGKDEVGRLRVETHEGEKVFEFGPDVQVRVNGEPASIARLVGRSGKPATVIYDLKTQRLTKALWRE